jgi:hypothetical protein
VERAWKKSRVPFPQNKYALTYHDRDTSVRSHGDICHIRESSKWTRAVREPRLARRAR